MCIITQIHCSSMMFLWLCSQRLLEAQDSLGTRGLGDATPEPFPAAQKESFSVPSFAEDALYL